MPQEASQPAEDCGLPYPGTWPLHVIPVDPDLDFISKVRSVIAPCHVSFPYGGSAVLTTDGERNAFANGLQIMWGLLGNVRPPPSRCG
jgi:hypothetical protein